MTPTPAQIEAAAKALFHQTDRTSTEWKILKEDGRLPWYLDAKAALTAAAKVGTEAEENHRMGFISGTAADGSKWDRWYGSLPSDLRRKLSLHDFKRLGDLFNTAAAEPNYWERSDDGTETIRERKAVTEAISAERERCARIAEVAESNFPDTMRREIAAAIRSLKDKP